MPVLKEISKNAQSIPTRTNHTPCQNFMLKTNIAYPALFTPELLESDLEKTEESDTSLNTEVTKKKK